MRFRQILAVSGVLALGACGGGDAGPVAPPVDVVASVDVTIASASLFVGQTSQLTATVRNDEGAPMSATVSYETSAPGIATVSATGLVTAVAPGSATISAKAGGEAGRVDVAVKVVPAASLALSPGRTFIVTGDTLRFSASVLDSTGSVITGHDVAWSVSDPEVASINGSGLLTPKRAGRVTVRATASEKMAESVIDITVGRGLRVPALAVFDSVLPTLMSRYELPGTSFALMKDGKLLLARSYGWADTTLKQPVEPSSRFRYASLSKPITAVAVMKLVEEGRLSLDDKVFEILDDLAPPEGQTPDPRLGDITVRHLLAHSSGWHAGDVQDALWMGREASATLGAEYPASARTYARYFMGQPLSFDPGTDWSYSNLGYVLAGLVVEEISGESYAEFVRDEIFHPSGADILAGKTPLSGRLPGEVRYYYYPGEMPDNTAPAGMAPAEYGQHSIEGNLAAAGWVGSAVDYLRFIAAVDGNAEHPDVLAPATVTTIFERPLPIWSDATTWYALGWYSRGASPPSGRLPRRPPLGNAELGAPVGERRHLRHPLQWSRIARRDRPEAHRDEQRRDQRPQRPFRVADGGPLPALLRQSPCRSGRPCPGISPKWRGSGARRLLLRAAVTRA